MPPKIGANVRLGGKTRTLRYTAPALMRVQEELDGANLQETVAEVGGISFRHIAVMVWGGLLHSNPDLTIGEAAEMVEPPIQRLVAAIMDALGPWITVVDEEDEEQAEGAKKKGSKDSRG